MRILITGFVVFIIWSFLSMWLYVDILKPETKKHVIITPVAEKPDREADSLAKLYASMPKDLLFFFDFDKTKVKEESSAEARIPEFIDWLEKYPSSTLTITGHSDFIGTQEYNFKLGMTRADAVRKYLESKGLPLNRMSIDSKGEDQPVALHITAQGRAMNRRTVVTIKM